jgi:hypothetical protein
VTELSSQPQGNQHYVTLPRQVVRELIQLASSTGYAGGHIDEVDEDGALADEDIRAACAAACVHLTTSRSLYGAALRELPEFKPGHRMTAYRPVCNCGWEGGIEVDDFGVVDRFVVVRPPSEHAYIRAAKAARRHADTEDGRWPDAG